MVSIVQNGTVQQSYQKTAQLGQNSQQAQAAAQDRRDRLNEPQASRASESASSQRSPEQDNRQFAVAQGTAARTDETVRETEQVRGSLLDISV